MDAVIGFLDSGLDSLNISSGWRTTGGLIWTRTIAGVPNTGKTSGCGLALTGFVVCSLSWRCVGDRSAKVVNTIPFFAVIVFLLWEDMLSLVLLV